MRQVDSLDKHIGYRSSEEGESTVHSGGEAGGYLEGAGACGMSPIWASRKEREHIPGGAIIQSCGENMKQEGLVKQAVRGQM